MEVLNRDSGLTKSQLLFLYLVQTTRDFGIVRLVKTILKADQNYFRESFKSISGYTYKKDQLGPFAPEINEDIEILKKENWISEVKTPTDFNNEKRNFLMKKQVNIDVYDVFSKKELECINFAKDELVHKSSNEASQETHDSVYHMFDMGEDIPLYMYLEHRGPTEKEKAAIKETYANSI